MITPNASALRVHARGKVLVTQIAETLGVPEAVLYEGGKAADPGTQILDDTVELIRLFGQIQHQKDRRLCVADVKAASEKLASPVAHDDGKAA